jgi:hypothetical protein
MNTVVEFTRQIHSLTDALSQIEAPASLELRGDGACILHISETEYDLSVEAIASIIAGQNRKA